MTQVSPTGENARDEIPKRPKGILKNSNSYQLASSQSPPFSNNSAPHVASSPSETDPLSPVFQESPFPSSNSNAVHPGLNREISDKELTLANTLANAGPRRNSSNTRSSMSGSASRRHSSAAMDVDGDENDGPRLKWDEANIYLAEQERGATMKIDEPKTPWAKQYDPIEDEEDLAIINAQDLVVDELDKAKGAKATPNSHATNTVRKNEQIPDLDLGEPEEPVSTQFPIGDGEKRVVVDDSTVEDTGPGHHGEELEGSMTAEQLRKHRQFEERRRRHYEMHNVKDMLSHPEENLEDMDEEDGHARPPVPSRT